MKEINETENTQKVSEKRNKVEETLNNDSKVLDFNLNIPTSNSFSPLSSCSSPESPLPSVASSLIAMNTLSIAQLITSESQDTSTFKTSPLLPRENTEDEGTLIDGCAKLKNEVASNEQKII